MRPPQQQAEGGGGPGLQTVFAVVLCFGKPYRLMVSKEGTVGWREAGSKSSVFGLMSLVIWLAAWPSDGMVLMLGLALLAQVAHRVKPGTGHSHAIGVSGFDRFTGRGGWVTAGLVGVGLGLGWRLFDRSAGAWLVASGAANLLTLAVLLQREKAVRQDQFDAILEARYRRG